MKRYLVTFFLWQIVRACVTSACGPTVATSPPSVVSVVASSHSERPAFHVVKKDESLATLKRRYHLSDGEIAAVIVLNRLRNPDLVHPGDYLALPAPKGAASTPASPSSFPWTGRLAVDLVAPMLLTMAPFLIGRTLRRPSRAGFGDSYETWTKATSDDDWHRRNTEAGSSRKTTAEDYAWTRATGGHTKSDQGGQSNSQSKSERPAPRRRGMDKATALSVLGLAQMPTPSVLKSAYRTHALRYHPDRNSGAHDAEEAFKKVGEAYCLLQKYCKDAA